MDETFVAQSTQSSKPARFYAGRSQADNIKRKSCHPDNALIWRRRADVKEGNQMVDAHPKLPLCLDQFLKLNSIAESGGHAKVMIQGGEVKLNGQVETRRRKKLSVGDVIEVSGGKWVVESIP